MLRTLLLIVLVLHGAIHFIGLVKAFGWAEVQELTRSISRPMGLVWAAAGILLLVAAVMLWIRCDQWWVLAFIGLLISQILIIQHWQDARFGTIANVLMLLAVIAAGARWNFKREYDDAAAAVVRNTAHLPDKILTDQDVMHLPALVRNYLHASGAVGRARPVNMLIRIDGGLRYHGKPWMPFTSIQFNRFDVPERHFWLDANMKGLPVPGYHDYVNGTASMKIKVLGLIPVADQHGPQMDMSETVTWFNDLCLLAPGALVDERIVWEELAPQRVKATFTHNGITISAILVFNEKDQLVDFVSDDRWYSDEDGQLKKYTFHTPLSRHGNLNGMVLPLYGEAAYELPEGSWSYGRFEMKDVRYNVR